jgi:hypothetical protein
MEEFVASFMVNRRQEKSFVGMVPLDRESFSFGNGTPASA